MSNITTQLEFCEAYREKRGGEEGIKLAKMGGYDTAPACTPWQPGSGAPYANPKNDEWFEMNPVGLKASQHKDKSGKKDVVRGCVIHVDVDAEKYVVPQGETVADHQERADAHYAAERERITAAYFNEDGSWKERDDVPRPHIVINTSEQTGNVQFIWFVEPIEFTDHASRVHFEGYNNGTCIALGSDASVTDVCRLFRRPFSVNVARGKKSSDYARQVSPTGLRWFDTELPAYSVEQFPHEIKKTGRAVMVRDDVEGHVPTDDAPHASMTDKELNRIGFAALDHVGDEVYTGPPGIGFEDIDMHELLASRVSSPVKGVALAALIIDGVDPGGHEDTSGSGTSDSAVHKLYGHGFDPDEIFMLMLNPNHAISYFARNDKGGSVRAVRRSLVRAMGSMTVIEFDDRHDFILNKDGIPIASKSYNSELALHKLGVTFSYDEFEREEYVTQNGVTEKLDDGIVDDLWFSIERTYGFRSDSTLFWKVCGNLCRRNRFNPVTDYFEKCHAEWMAAGRPRYLDRWLQMVAGSEATEFNCEAASIWAGAIVRRAFEPGCKFDEMLVLISKEGFDKSGLFRAMAPNDTYFSDSLTLTNTKPKQIIEEVTGKLIVEASDLSGLGGANREDIKNFLARQTDRGREAFKKKAVEIPRAWVAAGTTNKPEFLSGTDGNRRFWGIVVQPIELEIFKRIAPVLMGEAYQRHIVEEQSIRLDKRLYAAAAAVQHSQLGGNHWSDLMADYLDAYLDDVCAISIEDTYKLVGKGDPKDRGKRDVHDVADAMTKAGWVKDRIRHKGARSAVNCWVPAKYEAKEDRVNRRGDKLTLYWIDVTENGGYYDPTIEARIPRTIKIGYEDGVSPPHREDDDDIPF